MVFGTVENFGLDVADVQWGVQLLLQAVGYVFAALAAVKLVYSRWHSAYIKKYPTVGARDQLYNFINNCAEMEMAWHKSNKSEVSFALDTRMDAVVNSTTGVGVARDLPCIKIDYEKKTIVLPNSGKDVAGVLTSWQKSSIFARAKRIGAKYDELAQTQAILSLLPATSVKA